MIASHHRKQPKKRCRVTGKGFGVIIAATVMWLAGCAQTTTAPQSAAALALASSEPPAFQVKSTAQVQPVAPMPAAASARARQLIATWKSIKSTTDPTLPHDLFGEPSSVTVSYAHRNADGTLNYSWTAGSAGPTKSAAPTTSQASLKPQMPSWSISLIGTDPMPARPTCARRQARNTRCGYRSNLRSDTA